MKMIIKAIFDSAFFCSYTESFLDDNTFSINIGARS